MVQFFVGLLISLVQISYSVAGFPQGPTITYIRVEGYEIVHSFTHHWTGVNIEASCLEHANNHNMTGYESEKNVCRATNATKFLIRNAEKNTFVKAPPIFNSTCYAKYFKPLWSVMAYGNTVSVLMPTRGIFKEEAGIDLEAESKSQCAEIAVKNNCSGYFYDELEEQCRCCTEKNLTNCLNKSFDAYVVAVNSSDHYKRRYKHCRSKFEGIKAEDFLAVGDWSEFNACPASCGGAVQQRTRFVIAELQKEYPSVDEKVCATQMCPVKPRCSAGFITAIDANESYICAKEKP